MSNTIPLPEPLGYISKTGHGTHFRETITPELAALEHAGRKMWTPVVAAAVTREKDAEIAALRELLTLAQQGLLWYQDTYPDAVNECDHEVMAQIAAALAARGTT